MQIFTLNQALIDHGRAAFELSSLQFLSGPNASVNRADRWRGGGIGIVPGAIVAAIDRGLTTPEAIVPAIARLSRCRDSTVITLLETLGRDDVPDRLWSLGADGSYALTDRAVWQPITVVTS